MDQLPIKLSFPMGGIDLVSAPDEVDLSTSPYMLNMVPFDYLGQKVGCSRPLICNAIGAISVGVGTTGFVRTLCHYQEGTHRYWIALVDSKLCSTNDLANPLPGTTKFPQFYTTLPTFSSTQYPGAAIATHRNLVVVASSGGKTSFATSWDTVSGGPLAVTTSNFAPQNCDMAVFWRDRLCQSDGNIIYMSAIGGDSSGDYSTADAWDLTEPAAADAAIAFNTGGTLGGTVDTVTALIPWSDDRFVIGCSTTIHALLGDPRQGGTLNTAVPNEGVIGPKAWCMDSMGNLYFHGSRPPVPLDAGPDAGEPHRQAVREDHVQQGVGHGPDAGHPPRLRQLPPRRLHHRRPLGHPREHGHPGLRPRAHGPNAPSRTFDTKLGKIFPLQTGSIKITAAAVPLVGSRGRSSGADDTGSADGGLPAAILLATVTTGNAWSLNKFDVDTVLGSGATAATTTTNSHGQTILLFGPVRPFEDPQEAMLTTLELYFFADTNNGGPERFIGKSMLATIDVFAGDTEEEATVAALDGTTPNLTRDYAIPDGNQLRWLIRLRGRAFVIRVRQQAGTSPGDSYVLAPKITANFTPAGRRRG
jgi:hypothetical protein